MTITINGSGTITGASTLATTVASPTFTTPNIDSAQFATVSGTAPIYPCRAWVNFNGTGTVAIRASGNVTSITDNGTGDYTVNFTTAMTDVNYCSLVTGTGNAGVSIDGYANIRDPATNKLVGSVRVQTITGTSTPYDSPNVNVAIFR
jgi:hypothetical protein